MCDGQPWGDTYSGGDSGYHDYIYIVIVFVVVVVFVVLVFFGVFCCFCHCVTGNHGKTLTLRFSFRFSVRAEYLFIFSGDD